MVRRCCTACGKEVGGGKMGMLSHWGKHRREFKKITGRDASCNDDIRAFCKGLHGFFDIW